MKKIFYFIASAIVALGAVACQNEGLDNIAPEANGDTVSFVATIEDTKTDLLDNATIWDDDDTIVVNWIDGTEDKVSYFKNNTNDRNTFTCTEVGLSAIKEVDEIIASYSNKNDGTIDSEAGTAGAWLYYKGTFADLSKGNKHFEVKNAFLKFTADKGAVVTLTASAEIFSTGTKLTLTATGAEQYVAVLPAATTITYAVDGVEVKTSKENTLEVKKIYDLGNFYKELEAIDKTKRYIFKKTTEVKGGHWYAIVAENVAATAVTSDYGYLYTANSIEVGENENISLPASCAFGFTSTDGGYTIKQSDDRYLYMSGTYNSFNVTATPTSGHVFTAEITEGTATIVNVLKNKTVQYSKQYTSFGAYSTVTNVLPALYELVEVDNGSHILSVSDSSLSFPADGGEKVLTVTTYGTPAWEAKSDQTWAQVDYDTTTGEIVVNVAANEDSEARNATITVTYGTENIPVTIEQAQHIKEGETTTLLSEDFSTITSGNNTENSGSNSSWSGNTNFPKVNTAYSAGGAVRIGKSQGTGYITSKTLDLSGSVTVTLDVKGWTTVEGKINVTIGTVTKQITYTEKMSSEFGTYSVTFDAGTGTTESTITIATSAKRAFIDNVVVTTI